MSKLLYFDLETFSPIPINQGTHKYAEQAEVMLFAYAHDGGPVKVWDLTEDPTMPIDLKRGLDDPDTTLITHNGGMFDSTVLRHAMGIDLKPEKMHDTMAQALAHGLPGSLDKLCDIFNLPPEFAKSKAGKNYINLFCKPRPKNQKIRRFTRDTHPDDWAGFIEYARLDIESMRLLYNKIPKWNYTGREKELWDLDHRINNRGIAVDVDLAVAAIESVANAQVDLAERTQEITFGDLTKTTKRDAMLAYILDAYSIELPNLKIATLEKFVEDPDVPWILKDLITIRLMASSTSTSKYKTLVNGVSSDGILRGLLQFCGANRTGRWAGRLFQPQNLPRMIMDPVADYCGKPVKDLTNADVLRYIEVGISSIKNGCAADMAEDVMTLCLNLVRSTLIARPGKKLVISDLSNIEGRVAAWLAGEEWKVQAFRDFDTIIGKDEKGKAIRKGPDLYNVSYAKSFRVDVKSVDKEQRQVGKVQELALGYQGGVGAFLTFALGYNIDLDSMGAKALPFVPQRVRSEAMQFWGWASSKRQTMGLSQDTFVACDSLKRLWREAHPQIASYWAEMQNCAIQAIENPGITVPCRKIKFRRAGAWLRMILPSGRCLCYAAPKVEDGKISYEGINQYSRQWTRIKTYGGKLFENACQAVARDVMADNMPLIDDMGYSILLTVHDELITEAPDNEGFDEKHLSQMLAIVPSWARDLPLAAGGFSAYRYRKD